MSYIKTVEVNLFNVFTQTINIKKGLNIISGENGTCKSHFLKALRQLQNVTIEGDLNQLQGRIFAFNPKRNSERQSLEHVFQTLRQQNKGYDNFITETVQKQFNDQAIDTYSSCSELFYFFYDKKCKSGGDQKQYMKEVCDEFNLVISSIFDDYKIDATWDESKGAPTLKLVKKETEIPLNAVSCGEQEVLSLILNIYSAKDSVDIYLIDEPEVHLNWHLEEKLFEFLYRFCKDHEKQIVLTTHSRVIFKQKFHDLSQFFVWREGKIHVETLLPKEQRKKIAGEAIEIIKLGNFNKVTIFVEDESHKNFIEVLSEELGLEVTPVISGNSFNVKSMYKLSKEEGGWKNCFFMIDGDNQGNPFPNDRCFIHLDKYCIENYIFDISSLSLALNKSESDIRQLVLDSLLDVKNEIFKKNKFFEFLVDRLSLNDISDDNLSKLDASIISKSFLKKTQMKQRELFKTVIPMTWSTFLLHPS